MATRRKGTYCYGIDLGCPLNTYILKNMASSYGFCEDVLKSSKAFPALKADCEILAGLSYSMLLDNAMSVST